MGTKITAWGVVKNLEYAAIGNLNMADEYKTAIEAAKSAHDTVKGSADSGYTSALGTSDGTDGAYATKLLALTNKQSEIATALASKNSWAAQLVAQNAEEAAQLAIKSLAEGDVVAQTATVATLLSAKTAAASAKVTADSASSTATGAKGTAQSAYDAQVAAALATATTVSAPLAALATLRGTAATSGVALVAAVGALGAQQILVDTDQGVVDAALNVHLAAIVACKQEKFDLYAAALATAEALRASNLAKIETLVDEAKDAMPTRGAKGSRCEKAVSNGTFRPKRDEAICAEGLCCGAAKIPMGKVVMTIETCQAVDASTYTYVPPRAPMATSMPTGSPFPFTCIEGAQKLAAAASALAAAVYMLA